MQGLIHFEFVQSAFGDGFGVIPVAQVHSHTFVVVI